MQAKSFLAFTNKTSRITLGMPLDYGTSIHGPPATSFWYNRIHADVNRGTYILLLIYDTSVEVCLYFLTGPISPFTFTQPHTTPISISFLF